MLAELRIENFALIERLELELNAGLNVLTGETGAGKSIIIDAVSLLLGGRGSQEFVRSSCTKAFVEGVFRLHPDRPVCQRLAEWGYELEEDLLMLSRELSNTGRNVCRVQGRSVPLSLYRELGELLIDINGQHDYQSLLKAENHVYLLDALDEGLGALKNNVQKSARKVQEIQQQLDRLLGSEQDLARREDMLKFQVEEIEAARLVDGEEEELVQERSRLVNAEKLSSLTAGAYQKLFAGFERQQSALDLAAESMSHLKDLAEIDENAAAMLTSLEGAYYEMEEVARELRDYQESIVFDQGRQEEVEERLVVLKNLKRKYGASIAEIQNYYAEVAAELEQLSHQEELQAQLQHDLLSATNTYWQHAGELSRKRQAVAAVIEKKMAEELAELKMSGTEFQVYFAKRDKVHQNGEDIVEFMFSPNHGEPVKPLAKTASGGELSRVILALKTILAQVDPVPTLIFDEVDSGVGGEAVRKVAEKLAQIGVSRQVLCVTHSPQVASFADRHFFISKNVQEGRTTTKVTLLDQNERVQELARMLGGAALTELTVKHAEEMLKMASKK